MSDDTAPRTRGRPPLPDSERHSLSITFRVTKDEFSTLTELANINSLSMSDMLRAALRHLFTVSHQRH